jgi:riboflavin synthase
MFTGIVTEQGNVRRARQKGGILVLEIDSAYCAKDMRTGDSVAVNGVCLTAIEVGRRRFTVEAIPETLVRTTLPSLHKGSQVNLELAARVGDRVGGHLVQGHVDGTALAVRVEDDEGSKRMWFEADEDLLKYLIPKGSVTLDGIALTVVEVGRTSFQIAVIPHTLSVTSLGSVQAGSRVNLEVDQIAKYVERLAQRN